MKTIALIDPNTGGHHLTYLRLFSKTLLELGCQVMTFSAEPDGLTNWIADHCSFAAKRFYAFKMEPLQPLKLPLVGRVRTLPFIGPLPQASRILAKWEQAAASIELARRQVGVTPDLVFFNWLDGYFSHYLTHHLVDQLFPYDWAGLYFRPGHLRFKPTSLSRWRSPLPHYAIAKSHHCRAVALLDEWMVNDVQREINKPVMAFPDFTDESAPDLDYELVKQIREKAGKRKIIGLFGALSKRKGVLTLLDVAQRSQHENWFFVFAGSLSEHTFHQDYGQRFPEEYARMLSVATSAPSNCLFHFQHIPDEPQFNALIHASDVIFAAYENFPYSSNILAKAATFNKPLIASQGYCMGKRVDAFEMGVTIPEGDVPACIQALHNLLDPAAEQAGSLRFDFAEYRSQHSIQQLRHVFQSLLSLIESKLVVHR